MRIVLLAGVAMAATLGASASWAENGWYGAVDAGVHKPEHMRTTSAGAPDYVVSGKYNVVGFVRLGYRFSPYLRMEIEGGYRPGALKSVTSANGAFTGSICNVSSPEGACNSPGGVEHAWTIMGNVLV